MKSGNKGIWFGVFLLIVLATAWAILEGATSPARGSLPDLLRHLADDSVTELRILDATIEYRLTDGKWYSTPGTLNEYIMHHVYENDIQVKGKPGGGSWEGWVTTLVAVGIAILIAFFFISRSYGSAFKQAKGLTETRSRTAGEESRVKLADVGGCAEAKEMLQDVIHYLKDPNRWAQLGARLPRGILLEGPPGTGKTLLARAVAGETAAHFEFVSATEFVELFVGVGAARLRSMFDRVAKLAPAIIFIDELDAVGRRRGVSFGFNNEERENTLNQLLVLLDGFEKQPQVVIIAATNRSDILDPALIRPGRFDQRIKLGDPDRQDRLEILTVHTAGKKLSPEVSLERLAEATEGFSGAQLAGLVNEAALRAVRKTRTGESEFEITNADLKDALVSYQKTISTFSKLDQLLCESNSQLAEPRGAVNVRITLVDQHPIEGRVVWADPHFIKLQTPADALEIIAAKSQIVKIESI